MSTDGTFATLASALDSDASYTRSQITQAEAAVVRAAVAFRAGGKGCGELFDAVDALRRANERQAALDIKRSALERVKARQARGVKRLG
jgi:hypothetical protein